MTPEEFLRVALMVSIPLSEFCWLKLERDTEFRGKAQCFNSPLGILLVEAPDVMSSTSSRMPVSIPLSEFCWLKPSTMFAIAASSTGFNSPLGILLVEAIALLEEQAP